MLRIQRQCRIALEERIAVVAKSNPKAYYNYVQSNAALLKAMGGVKNHQETGSTGIQEKAHSLLKFF